MIRDVNRGRESIDEALGDGDGQRLVRLLQQERKLVTPEPSEGVAGANHRGEPPCDFLEQLIAGVVAERVVDLLELVEVDEQDGERVAVREERTSDWTSRSRKRARFASPVRLSWNA